MNRHALESLDQRVLEVDRAYGGWRWAVTVARAPRAKIVTVDESVLLPGPDSLLAPAWVPWQDRLRPGDVGIGDLLPASADDERLVPSASLDGDDAVTDWFLPRPDTEDADAGPGIAEVVAVSFASEEFLDRSPVT